MRPTAAGLTQSPAEGQDRQTHPIGIPISSGKDGDIQGDAGPRALSMEVKATDPASSKPVIASGEEGPSIPSPAADSRLPSGLASGGKGLDPASVPPPSIDAQTPGLQSDKSQPIAPADVNKEAVPTGQVPEPVKNAGPEPSRVPAAFQDTGTAMESKTPTDMASSEDDTAGSRGNTRYNRTQRIAMTEVKETESQKDQSLDSLKSTPVESIKSQTGFQDTAKAMAVEQSTIAAEKPTTGQAAASTRTDPSAVKSFQGTVMDQIVDQASLRSIGGRSEVQIRLKPDFLGNVQMNIATDKEQVVVRIITDQPVVKDIIETHLHHLKAELQHQGLTIDKFDVMVSPDADQQHSREQFSQMFKNNSSNHGRRQAPDHAPERGNPQGDHPATDDERNRDGVNYFA
jgi:flagellar hook-length control protein FliK